jgi:hypothetical protein
MAIRRRCPYGLPIDFFVGDIRYRDCELYRSCQMNRGRRRISIWTAPLNETVEMGTLCWERAAKWSGSDALVSFNAWQLSAC